jgi:hypothetical protein
LAADRFALAYGIFQPAEGIGHIGAMVIVNVVDKESTGLNAADSTG